MIQILTLTGCLDHAYRGESGCSCASWRNLLERLCYESVKFMTDNVIRTVRWLFRRPWFSRACVIQDVYLARTAFVYGDLKCVSWADIVTATRGLRNEGDITSLSTGRGIIWGKLPCVLELHLRLTRRKTSILKLMYMARTCRTNDVRDKIYALCGISIDIKRLNILPSVTSAHFSSAISTQAG